MQGVTLAEGRTGLLVGVRNRRQSDY